MPQREIIHLVFKTHLDIGFTDFARNVLQTYFDVFIPSAIATAQRLRDSGSADRFIWTTGSWLIYEYLERGNPQQRQNLEQAIEAGDIRWHGLPFTTHTELMDKSLFQHGLQLSQRLDKRFGKQTIAGKMTDVPGHTRGMIPLLAEAGIRFLHIGVNEASTPPDVPPVFVWRDPTSHTQIMVMYQRSGYGGFIRVPESVHTLAFAHTNDNQGAQSFEEVQRIFRDMRQQFPDAAIIGSTLDEFANHLLDVEAHLPIIEHEIGDTWIHGVGSDPTKISRYRELVRLRHHWLTEERVPPDDPRLMAFSNHLMLIPEHTWGLDEKVHLHDTVHYEKRLFQTARSTEPFRTFESSWAEQRCYLDTALKALGDSHLNNEATDYLKALLPAVPEPRTYERADAASVFDTSQFEIGFDKTTGAIIYLIDKSTHRQWASPSQPLGLFRYQTFSQTDYDRFWKNYIINKRKTRVWSWDDYTKPGVTLAYPESRFWLPRLVGLYQKRHSGGTAFLQELKMEDEASEKYGCPRSVFVQVDLLNAEKTLQFDVQWFEKPASRLPEAVWYSFQPIIRRSGQWYLDKLGAVISPLDVIKNGNRKLHAVDNGIQYRDTTSCLKIETLDAPLVAPGEPSLLNFNNRQPVMKHGMHFNLFNNVWGTNFPMWFEDDVRIRFNLKIT